MRRFALFALLAVACATTPTVAPTSDPVTTAGAVPGARGAPSGAPATPSPAPPWTLSPTGVPASVPLHPPDLVVRPHDPARAALYEVLAVEGVEHIAGLVRLEATEAGSGTPVTVVGVDPATFRPVTPEVTAQTPAVWERLAADEALALHEVAYRLRLELGGPLTLTHGDRSVTLRLGALASNGTPPVGDVVVPWQVAADLGVSDTNLLVVALAEGVDAERAGRRIAEVLGGADVAVLTGPTRGEARLRGTSVQVEPFTYLDLGDGTIVIDPAWVRRNIVSITLPRLGTTLCHRLMVAPLQGVFAELAERGLLELLDPDGFGGCWVPRHIEWDPTRGLSMHAWGLAIDINTHDNWIGEPPTLDPRIVEVFERWGFVWGGRWARPDGMHFELRRLPR